MKASRRGFLGGILGAFAGLGLISTEKQITGPTLSDPVLPLSPEPDFVTPARENNFAAPGSLFASPVPICRGHNFRYGLLAE